MTRLSYVMTTKEGNMKINEMTRKELEALPHRQCNEEIECDSIIIIPGRARDLHDSGYRCMDCVAVRNGEPICLLAGGSDVLHINGIGGYGYRWVKRYATVPKSVPPIGWSIDCLPKSGLLRIFAGSGWKLVCGPSFSSFEMFAVEESGGEKHEDNLEVSA